MKTTFTIDFIYDDIVTNFDPMLLDFGIDGLNYRKGLEYEYLIEDEYDLLTNKFAYSSLGVYLKYAPNPTWTICNPGKITHKFSKKAGKYRLVIGEFLKSKVDDICSYTIGLGLLEDFYGYERETEYIGDNDEYYEFTLEKQMYSEYRLPFEKLTEEQKTIIMLRYM